MIKISDNAPWEFDTFNAPWDVDAFIGGKKGEFLVHSIKQPVYDQDAEIYFILDHNGGRKTYIKAENLTYDMEKGFEYVNPPRSEYSNYIERLKEIEVLCQNERPTVIDG